ncbi:hypothetical protein C8R45DRAFT_937769 [Mycena sanguinolenta]|nr:hypothetical protein C8R45DRAFT_937769 [Mycena sanguinolenta]
MAAKQMPERDTLCLGSGTVHYKERIHQASLEIKGLGFEQRFVEIERLSLEPAFKFAACTEHKLRMRLEHRRRRVSRSRSVGVVSSQNVSVSASGGSAAAGVLSIVELPNYQFLKRKFSSIDQRNQIAAFKFHRIFLDPQNNSLAPPSRVAFLHPLLGHHREARHRLGRRSHLVALKCPSSSCREVEPQTHSPLPVPRALFFSGTAAVVVHSSFVSLAFGKYY